MPLRHRRLAVGSCALALLASAVHAGAQPPAARPEVKMEYVGKAFLFDYGEMVIRVDYVSATTLRWEQVKGPQAGLTGEETYGFSAVRPGVLFIWWQEKDTAIVTQVVDFERGRVHTTWTSPEKKLAAFQGAVRKP
jgi:hypothetical protein